MTTDAGLNVVPLRDNYAPVTDLPGRLRLLADQIQQGQYGDVFCGMVLFQARHERQPLITLLGSTPSATRYYYCGLLADAQRWMLKDCEL